MTIDWVVPFICLLCTSIEAQEAQPGPRRLLFLKQDVALYNQVFERARTVLTEAEPDTVIGSFDLPKQPSAPALRDLASGYDAVVSIGTPAFKAAVEHVPAADHVYSMIVALDQDVLRGMPEDARARVRGISILPAPASYIAYTREIQPESRAIGLLYVSDSFEAFVHELRREAAEAGVAVVAEKVRGRQGLVPAFDRVVKANIDAYFILPDFALYDTRAVEHVLLNAFQRGVPCIGPSDSFVRSGALWAFVIDPNEVGNQLGTLLASDPDASGGVRHYAPTSVALNVLVMEKLDIQAPFRIRKDATLIDPRIQDEK